MRQAPQNPGDPAVLEGVLKDAAFEPQDLVTPVRTPCTVIRDGTGARPQI